MSATLVDRAVRLDCHGLVPILSQATSSHRHPARCQSRGYRSYKQAIFAPHVHAVVKVGVTTLRARSRLQSLFDGSLHSLCLNVTVATHPMDNDGPTFYLHVTLGLIGLTASANRHHLPMTLSQACVLSSPKDELPRAVERAESSRSEPPSYSRRQSRPERARRHTVSCYRKRLPLLSLLLSPTRPITLFPFCELGIIAAMEVDA